MRLFRVFTLLLPVLLVWPVLSSAIVLSAAGARAPARRMACCATSCGTCARCASEAGAGCELERGAPAGGCELAATPCHRPVTRAGSVFAWEPFLPAPCGLAVRPPLVTGASAAATAAPRSRTPETPERPPSA